MIYEFGEFRVNTAKRQVRRGNTVLNLEPRSYQLLTYFIENRDKAIGKDELQDEIWGTIVTESALTRSIMKLRQSIGDTDGTIIKTVRGFGYRFGAEVSAPETSAPAKSVDTPTKDRNVAVTWLAIAAVIAAAVILGYVVIDGVFKKDVDPKSIAVLPFDDLSQTQDQRWFADGLAEEILNSLARTPDLSVAGRTSSFSFRDSNEDIPSIAGALGVAHILEGSVRRQGDQIRVTAQLIRARDGMHIWSENFDHPAADLIQVQEAIAINIATALKTATDPEALAAVVSSGTLSVTAFEAYLHGLAGQTSMLATGDISAYTESIDAFEEAVAIDPEFALAYGEIAKYWVTQLSRVAIASNRRDKSVTEIRAAAEAALDSAIRYARDEVESTQFRTIKAMTEVKLNQALELNTAFLEVRPHDRQAQGRQLNLLAQLNMFDEISEIAFEFYARDGFDPLVTGRSIHTMMYSNNRPAISAFLELVDANLNSSRVAMYQAHRGLLWIGETQRARELHDELIGSDLSRTQRTHVRLRQLCAEGKTEEAKTLYDSATSENTRSGSFPWLAANTMGYPGEGLESLYQFDEDQNLNALAGFLLYGSFDPRPFPNLMAHLEIHGNETGFVPVVPYRCFHNGTAAN